MPFKSKAQERAAFAGYLWVKMKKAAPERAAKTDQKSLPKKVNKSAMRSWVVAVSTLPRKKNK